MPYVSRINGTVNGVYANLQPGYGEEFLSSDNVEVLAFLDQQTPTIAKVKESLKGRVDANAETARLRYITGGSGQALTYAQKADEAKAYLAAAVPVDADYPLMAAEVGITAPTLAEVAVVVRNAFAQWQQIGAAIEAKRLGTKAAIDVATSIEAAEEAAIVAWP